MCPPHCHHLVAVMSWSWLSSTCPCHGCHGHVPSQSCPSHGHDHAPVLDTFLLCPLHCHHLLVMVTFWSLAWLCPCPQCILIVVMSPPHHSCVLVMGMGMSPSSLCLLCCHHLLTVVMSWSWVWSCPHPQCVFLVSPSLSSSPCHGCVLVVGLVMLPSLIHPHHVPHAVVISLSWSCPSH